MQPDYLPSFFSYSSHRGFFARIWTVMAVLSCCGWYMPRTLGKHARADASDALYA